MHIIREEIVSYWNTSKKDAGDVSIIGALDLIKHAISAGISNEDNIDLCKPIATNEVEIVLQSMDASKALDPNDFFGYFIKHY